jgi:hypothetical protein
MTVGNERLARHGSEVPTYACTKLRRGPQQVGEARKFTRTVLGKLIPKSVLDDVMLLVSELTTRAVAHPGGVVTLCIELTDVSCIVTVHDIEPETVETPRPGCEKAELLGMAIISALAELHQVTDERGVSITAELPWKGDV